MHRSMLLSVLVTRRSRTTVRSLHAVKVVLIQGVEFTYLRVADIAMNNELVDGQRQVGVLYGFAEGTVLQAIGLTAADAHKSENGTR